jgi:alkane 1-monooxygenase
MHTRWLKYSLPLSFYIIAFFSFSYTGWACWLPMVYAWVLIPLIELLIKPNTANMQAAEEELVRKDRKYDYLLYLVVLLQYPSLIFFLFSFDQPGLTGWDIAGRIGAMGLLCGVFGINVGHELGHRIKPFEQVLAKISLSSSLYMHFFIEHNKGHHKHVATPQDPSSARYNEMLYTFFFRTIVFSYISAWRIANEEQRKKGKPVFHPGNEMLQAQVLQGLLIAAVFYFFGTAGWYFLASAFMGILLLETVNYIEHYGLQRRKLENGKYERALPVHSWNSNHVLGRLVLFELSRHSDHHYLASRPYQVLRHHDEAPQLPTGYPGSMLLSLLPPAWFYVMNRRIRALQANN